MATTSKGRPASARRVVPVLILVVVTLAAACQWSAPRYDIGGSANNRTETTIGAAQVPLLTPRWRAPIATSSPRFTANPVTSGGLLFTTATDYVGGRRLLAFDRKGASGCSGSTAPTPSWPSGTPQLCEPVWQAISANSTGFGQPAVYDGVLFVDDGGTLRAFDAAGEQGCSGVPTVCQPLWSGTTGGGQPLVADGELYVVGGRWRGAEPNLAERSVAAYAAFDTSACSGSPLVCQPLRYYEPPDVCWGWCRSANQVIRGDELILAVDEQGDESSTGRTHVFDRTGSTGCSGTPVICTTAQITSTYRPGGLAASADATYASGNLHVSGVDEDPDLFTYQLTAMTTTGTTMWTALLSDTVKGIALGDDAVWVASGASVVAFPVGSACATPCAPIRVASTTANASTDPAIANDLLYVGAGASLKVFDATGATGCGGSPTTCTPLRSIPLPAEARSVTISLGLVYVAMANGEVLALGLPPS